MKLKDIFIHQWVMENEREVKEAKVKIQNGNGNSYNDRLVANIIEGLSPKKTDKLKNGFEEMKIKDEEDKNSEVDIIFKVHKQKKTKKEVSETLIASFGGDDLFDSILDKVKDKNKGNIIII
jgi:hypothetical protein